MNDCIVCGKPCKNKFCSISCRNIYWNPKTKKGNICKNHFTKERIEETRKCKCGKEFVVYGTVAELKTRKCKRFCSIKCANSRSFSEKTKEIKSKISTEYFKNNYKKYYCKVCGTELPRYDRHQYCSNSCKEIFWRSKYPDKDEMHSYRLKCKFKFNPFKYSDFLDTDLLKKYGFYSPANKKNNLEGASLDHLYSIRDGFDNNVDSYLMSHVMNCQILRHSDNISKGKKSIISLEDLKKRVLEFDTLHGPVAQLVER